MSTLFRSYAALAPVWVLLALTACSKSNDAYPEPAVAASWMMDGQERTSISARAETSFDKVNVYIYQDFVAPDSKGSVVTVSLFIPKKVGTYTIGPNSEASANFADLNTSTGQNNDSYSADAGSITVSSLTPTSVSGTFALTGKGYLNKQLTKSLTNGKFKAAL